MRLFGFVAVPFSGVSIYVREYPFSFDFRSASTNRGHDVDCER